MSDWTIGAFADEAGSSLEEQIDALKGNHLQYLEARNIEGKNFSSVSALEAREIRDRLRDNGLSLLTVGSPFGKIRIDEPFGPHLDEFKHALELSHIVGAEYIRLFSFYIPDTIEDKKVCLPEVLERMNAFCDAAQGSGILLCHENEKGIYGDTAADCLTLLTCLPQVRGIFDPANFLQCGQETWSAWEMLHGYIEYLHIKDVDCGTGQVVPAGKGDGKVPEILRAYKAQGGKMMTVEPHLSVFDGLAALEQGGNVSHIGKYRYPSKRAAFDAAITALREILP